jgi:hypothetical protein
MKVLVCFLFFCIACQKSNHPIIKMPVDIYKLVGKFSDKLSDNVKIANKSKVELEVNFDNGDFKGKYENEKFKGNFAVESLNAGFAYGFKYSVSLNTLEKNVSENQEYEGFINKLKATTSIVIEPNKLMHPDFIKLTLKDEMGTELLRFLKVN